LTITLLKTAYVLWLWKNYLFAGSQESAQCGVVIYSLLATCKIRDVEPFGWLKYALDTIPDYPANQLEKLLPAK
jgi:transposase